MDIPGLENIENDQTAIDVVSDVVPAVASEVFPRFVETLRVERHADAQVGVRVDRQSISPNKPRR
jgi:hypothetical protein